MQKETNVFEGNWAHTNNWQRKLTINLKPLVFLYLARVIIWLPENPTAHEGLIHVYGCIFKHAANCASVFQLFQMLVSKSQLGYSEDMKLCPVQRANISLSFCSVFSHDEKNSAVMKNVDRHHPQWCRNDDPCRELFSKRGEKYSGEMSSFGKLGLYSGLM